MADEPSEDGSAKARPIEAIDPAAHGASGIAPDSERTSVAQTSIQMVQWQGHYPPPEAVERFERLAPGAFDRMLSMAERAQAGQLATVADVNRNIREDAQRGALLGTAITLASMLGAGVCAYIGQPWVAGAFLGVPVLSVARSLIETTRRR